MSGDTYIDCNLWKPRSLNRVLFPLRAFSITSNLGLLWQGSWLNARVLASVSLPCGLLKAVSKFHLRAAHISLFLEIYMFGRGRWEFPEIPTKVLEAYFIKNLFAAVGPYWTYSQGFARSRHLHFSVNSQQSKFLSLMLLWNKSCQSHQSSPWCQIQKTSSIKILDLSATLDILTTPFFLKLGLKSFSHNMWHHLILISFY